MSPPIDIDGSEIQRATIDGEDVSEITIDGQQTAGFVDIPDSAIFQLSADNLSLNDGDPVTDWTDQIGGLILNSDNDAPIYQTGADLDPTVRVDGNDGMDVSQPSNFPTGSEARSVAVVHQYDTNTEQTSTFTSYGVKDFTNRFQVGANRNGNDEFFVEIGGSGNFVVTDSVYSNGGEFISFFVYPAGSGLDQGNVYINGNQASYSSTDSTTPNTGTDEIELFEFNGSFRLTGDVSEIMYYDSALTDSERQSEESRLSDKWGITL